MRNASTSMSKRAPSARRGAGAPGHLAVHRVQRAAPPRPIATSTATGAGPPERVDDQRGHPADQHRPGQRHPVRRARAGRRRDRRRPRRSATQVTTPYARPASHPATPSPTVAAEHGQQDDLDDQADAPDRFEPWAPCLRDLWSTTSVVDTRRMRSVRFGSPGQMRRKPVTRDARAFWLRSPGAGEIRPVTLPDARPGRGAGPHPATPGSAGAPRRWSSRAACRRASTPRCGRRSRRATSPARSSTATSTSAWSRQGPPALRGRTVFCLYPHQTAYVVPAARGDRRCRTGCRRPGRCWPARWRPRSTRCGTPRRWSATGSRVVGGGHGRLLRRGAAGPVPRGAGRAGRRRPGRAGGRRGARASSSRCRPTRPAGGTWSCTPAPPPPACSARWTCSPRRAPSSS